MTPRRELPPGTDLGHAPSDLYTALTIVRSLALLASVSTEARDGVLDGIQEQIDLLGLRPNLEIAGIRLLTPGTQTTRTQKGYRLTLDPTESPGDDYVEWNNSFSQIPGEELVSRSYNSNSGLKFRAVNFEGKVYGYLVVVIKKGFLDNDEESWIIPNLFLGNKDYVYLKHTSKERFLGYETLAVKMGGTEKRPQFEVRLFNKKAKVVPVKKSKAKLPG